MIGKKRRRPKKENKKIELKIRKKKENFELISYKLEKADELFKQFKKEKLKKNKWKIINKIVELVEINPKFNFELLKLNKENDKGTYGNNFNQLSPTLSEKDYYSLTKKYQENPAIQLFNLLNLYLTDQEKFIEKTKLIINNKYNIPLIEGNEKIRINYYIQLFSHYEVYLNDVQKQYILNNKFKISERDKSNLIALQNKYDIVKRGIKFFGNIIKKLKYFFNGINLEEKILNIKLLTFLLYVTDIIQRIESSGQEPLIINNYFLKEIEPKKEIEENNSLINLIDSKKSLLFPGNYGIKKKYDNNKINI